MPFSAASGPVQKTKPALLVYFRKDAQSQPWVSRTLTSHSGEPGSLFHFQTVWIEGLVKDGSHLVAISVHLGD